MYMSLKTGFSNIKLHILCFTLANLLKIKNLQNVDLFFKMLNNTCNIFY